MYYRFIGYMHLLMVWNLRRTIIIWYLCEHSKDIYQTKAFYTGTDRRDDTMIQTLSAYV
jgi:hypothetical protein